LPNKESSLLIRRINNDNLRLLVNSLNVNLVMSAVIGVPVLSENNHSEWWRGASIYQIYPRSFMDSNGDGIGDLQGIIQRLHYVADLGVDGIWISPFFTSPMKDFGYDVADYKAVDPVFGDLSDFAALTDKAHQLGLKVIIDQVYSHTSDQHNWFQQSRQNTHNPYSDWYVWREAKDDGTPPNNWQSIFSGPAWTWDNRRKQYYLHNFLSSQPDLNLYNEQVQQALFEVARFWLDLGVDGFRLDAINYGMYDKQLRDNPPRSDLPRKYKRPALMQKPIYSMSQPGMPELLKQFRQVLDQYGVIFTVAEVGGEDPVTTMKSYVSDHDKLSTAYSFEFLGMQTPSADNLKNVLGRWSNHVNEGWPSWAFSNHDVSRILTRWAGEHATDQQAKLYLLLLASLRGNLFLYQGEELGLHQSAVPFDQLQDPEAILNWPDNMGRDGARTPIPWQHDAPYYGFSNAKPWLPVELHHPQQSVSAQASNPDSILAFSKQVFALRKQDQVLRLGDWIFSDEQSGLIAFERRYQNQSRCCVFNTTDKPIAFKSLDLGSLTPLIAVGKCLDSNGEFAPQSGSIWIV
jgi:alpha-glucosidase